MKPLLLHATSIFLSLKSRLNFFLSTLAHEKPQSILEKIAFRIDYLICTNGSHIHILPSYWIKKIISPRQPILKWIG